MKSKLFAQIKLTYTILTINRIFFLPSQWPIAINSMRWNKRRFDKRRQMRYESILFTKKPCWVMAGNRISPMEWLAWKSTCVFRCVIIFLVVEMWTRNIRCTKKLQNVLIESIGWNHHNSQRWSHPCSGLITLLLLILKCRKSH